MTPTKSYIICATPRSGSFLLCEALICTSVAGGPGEYFWKGNEEGFRTRWGVTSYQEYVQAAIAQGSTPNGVFGVKVMRGYLDDIAGKMAQLEQFLGRDLRSDQMFAELFPNLQYMWMTRRDKIRQAISWHRAIETGTWAWDRDEPPELQGEPRYDYSRIHALLQEIVRDEARWNEFFRVAGLRPLSVVYEDLAGDYEGTARRALSFLGIREPEPLLSKPRRMRRQSDRLSEQWYARFLQDADQEP